MREEGPGAGTGCDSGAQGAGAGTRGYWAGPGAARRTAGGCHWPLSKVSRSVTPRAAQQQQVRGGLGAPQRAAAGVSKGDLANQPSPQQNAPACAAGLHKGKCGSQARRALAAGQIPPPSPCSLAAPPHARNGWGAAAAASGWRQGARWRARRSRRARVVGTGRTQGCRGQSTKGKCPMAPAAAAGPAAWVCFILTQGRRAGGALCAGGFMRLSSCRATVGGGQKSSRCWRRSRAGRSPRPPTWRRHWSSCCRPWRWRRGRGWAACSRRASRSCPG